MVEDCGSLTARITALEKMLDEREDRTKERFIALDKNITVAMMAADKAVGKAEMATEKRFEGVNEFRSTLADQAATLLPRAEFQVQHKSLLDKIDGLDARLAAMENSAANIQGRIWAIGAIWSIFVVAVSIGVRFIGH
jgi:hypothetical protein